MELNGWSSAELSVKFILRDVNSGGFSLWECRFLKGIFSEFLGVDYDG